MAAKRPTTKLPKSAIKMPQETTLENHLTAIRSLAAAGVAADEAQGACLVSDPQTGQSRCIRTDATTCKALHGVFIGGPCGG